MRVLIFLVLCICAPPLLAQTGPEGRVLVTVGGAIPEGNLPPQDEDDVNVFGKLDLSYEIGFGFDDESLASFEQVALTVPYYRGDTPIAFTGPRLADVLRQVGAEGQTIQGVALDGYTVEIPWETIAEHTPILATHADGRPLPIGGWGPTAIVYPLPEGGTRPDDLAASQIWALVYIGVD